MPWITLTVCKMQKVGPLYSWKFII
jgi:hypothetical protein